MSNLTKLLSDVQTIVKHHNEISAIKGDSFNVFSILKLETKEEGTHSAFIGELLNPKGSHMMGPIFLELFIETISHEGKFTCENAKLSIERHIGAFDKENRTGGRIDIFIEDNEGQIISIENKIYAPDQLHQIERYANYKKHRNTVYYLTLEGAEPYEESKGELVEKTDFHRLSYSQDIVSWLEKCQKESVEKPIIRETIRQYLILIKKLTNQLSDNVMEEKVIYVIAKDYASARTIADAIESAEKEYALILFHEIKSALVDKIKEDLGTNSKWSVELKESTAARISTEIKIRYSTKEKYCITIEADNNIHKNNIYYGIYVPSEPIPEVLDKLLKTEKEFFENFKKEENYPAWDFVTDMGFWDSKERIKLFDENERRELVESCTEQIMALVEVIDKHVD